MMSPGISIAAGSPAVLPCGGREGAAPRRLSALLACLFCMLCLNSCFAPGVGYVHTPKAVEKRAELARKFMDFLPGERKNDPAAREEAKWLADTAYIASAEIARLNRTVLPNWMNNMLINGNFRDRGLCWHYQHDLYRELRRRPLKYFRVGCCVRDQNRAAEHNCVYVTSREREWPECILLDPWARGGYLTFKEPEDIGDNWKDFPEMAARLSVIYPEGHKRSFAHWYMIRWKDGKYHAWYEKGSEKAPQYQTMLENIRRYKNARAAADAP